MTTRTIRIWPVEQIVLNLFCQNRKRQMKHLYIFILVYFILLVLVIIYISIKIATEFV